MEGPSTSAHVEQESAVEPLTNEPPSETPSPRCTQCNLRPNETGRNLVVCIDGTSNQFGQNNTNVVKLYAKINQESNAGKPKQLAYYSSGIGTRPKPLHVIDRIGWAISDQFDMAVAWNVEEIVKDAYGWLARTYQEGDQIYLFGFSRGAYQVRVLAGMIQEVGLIRTPTEKQIGTAYDHYEAISSGQPKTKQIAREFKNTFSWKGLRVHFVGVWDTVSSVGLIRGDIFLSKSSSTTHACHFRQALALDERRVKFMPEYLCEMNPQPDDEKTRSVTSNVDKDPANSPSEPRSLISKDDISDSKKKSDVKEVWFAGCHSDVGGKNRPGRSRQAGNVPLLWMRREAMANGLLLMPTDIVWVPDDLGSGTSNSMTLGWRAIEYLPIKHQVSFSGVGGHAFGFHRLQPRRIIPGQKIHASVLYANAYKPKARLGEGFEIPVVQHGLEDTEPDDQIWENGLFDDTAADELLTCLSSQRGIAPIYLDRLLFMLRFKEGKQCIRKVSGFQDKLIRLIGNPENSAPLVRLVAVVAYYEASCHHETTGTCALLPIECHFDSVQQCLRGILEKHKHRDAPRVVTLLRPLTKHPTLRERILTKDVLEILVGFLDAIIHKPKKGFGQAMDGLSCLLKCDDTREFFVAKLQASPPSSNKPRLSQILNITDSRFLTATLRMVLTLVRTLLVDEARKVCSAVKPKIQKLATKRGRLVGHLAIEILFVLNNSEDDWNQMNIRRDPRVRANIASVLGHPNLKSNGLADGKGSIVEPGRGILRDIFGVGARSLEASQKALIRELKNAVENGRARERTAATMTLLKLCETAVIRDHLRGIGLLEVFIDQLRRKDSALLAAYALTTCLKLDDMNMKESIKNNKDLSKYIVDMLKLDYFDDAVGSVEGFEVFRDLMGHAELREKIKDQITDVLNNKLEKGKPKETRTSLICLDIFRSFDSNGPWTAELVKRSLERLRTQEWKSQKAGVTILYALAQTEHGVEVIQGHINEIVKMLNSEHRAASTSESSESQSVSSRPSSWMLGPACALRNLAQNETLRIHVCKTPEYSSLKDSFLSGTLISEADTSPWRVNTPTRDDVATMLDKMIKAVDKEVSEEGLLSIGDSVLPHIAHWDRLRTMLRNRTVAAVTVLPALLGVSALAVSAAIVVMPVYVSIRTYDVLKRLLSRYLGNLTLKGSHRDASEEDKTGQDQITPPREGSAPSPRNGEVPAHATGEEHTQDVGATSPEVDEIQRSGK